jgi:polyamine oxidase
MMERRAFIRMISMAGSAALLDIPSRRSRAQNTPLSLNQLLLKHFPPETDVAPTTSPRNVIVIGAGTAGLAAARILRDASVPTIVLEARDRLGGRTWTVDLGGVPVDMNGGYLHDLDVNRLARLYEEAGWAVDDTVWFDIHANGYDAMSGQTLGYLDKLRLAYHLARYFKGPDDPPRTLATDYPMERWTRKFFADAQLPDATGRLIESIIRSVQSTDGAEMSTYWHGKAGKEGGKWVFPRGGYGPFVAALAQDIDVRLNKPVTGVELQGNGMRVLTADEQFEASHVLVTVPLGVLKAKGIDFVPALPPGKLDAIARTGFAKMEKLAILLRAPIQDEDFTLRVYYDAQSGCRLTFQNFSKRLGRPILVAYAHTDYVSKFIQHSQDEREGIVLNALRAMLGQPQLQAESVVHSAWSDDPYSQGAYSFVKVHGGPQLMNMLSTPLCGGRLLFAGEATDVDRFSFVDGAVATGVREARRLLHNRVKA